MCLPARSHVADWTSTGNPWAFSISARSPGERKFEPYLGISTRLCGDRKGPRISGGCPVHRMTLDGCSCDACHTSQLWFLLSLHKPTAPTTTRLAVADWTPTGNPWAFSISARSPGERKFVPYLGIPTRLCGDRKGPRISGRCPVGHSKAGHEVKLAPLTVKLHATLI